MDQLAEDRVFLRRAADHRERPDRVAAVIDVLDPHHREIVGQAVVAQVIAERPFGLEPRGVDVAGDAEVGLGVDGQLAGAADHRHAAAAQHAGQGQLAHAFGQRHHRGDGHGRRPAHEDVHPQRLAAAEGGGVVGGDAAVDLVVQPDLAVRLVLPAGKLHAVHAQVAPGQARRRRGLRCRLAAR